MKRPKSEPQHSKMDRMSGIHGSVASRAGDVYGIAQHSPESQGPFIRFFPNCGSPGQLATTRRRGYSAWSSSGGVATVLLVAIGPPDHAHSWVAAINLSSRTSDSSEVLA